MKTQPTEISVSDELPAIRPLQRPTLEQELAALRANRPATKDELDEAATRSNFRQP